MLDAMGGVGAFLEAAESRSFVAAGRTLGVSASAIGKAVARLEERLGVRLFHRSTRSITLTPEGALFRERCRRIVCELEVAEQELTQATAAPRGKLRVSLPLVGMLLMPVVRDFLRAYPAITLELDFTDRLVDVIEEGFDAVIRTGELRDSRLKTRALGTFSHRIVGSPAYFTQRGIPRKPEMLVKHACLHHRYPSTGKLERWPLREPRSDLEWELPVTTVASTLEPLIFLAENGLGLACLPYFAVERQLRDGTLVSVLDDFMEDVGMFRILWPSSRYPSPKVQAFVDFMAEHLFPRTDAERTTRRAKRSTR